VSLPRRLEATITSILALAAFALLLALPAMMWTGCSRHASAGEPGASDTASANVASTSQGSAAVDAGASVKRGEYMVTIGGCNDCHTPMKMGPKGPEPDMSRMLSGHPESLPLEKDPMVDTAWSGMSVDPTATAFHGGWGTSYSMNLTPDTLTGIGNWTEEMFIKTIRTGKHWGVGRPIMPPMPWFNYAKFTDDDIKSVYAYLRTIPPVKNHPPAYRPPSAPMAAK
jgi:mono/diheme cytochrome c family protein